MSDLPDGDTLLGLLGTPASAPAMRELLETLGALPLPAFEPDDEIVSYRDLDAGYEIQLRDSSPRGTPVLFTAFFYAGLVRGYGRFSGKLPRALSWTDTEASTVAKLGSPALVGLHQAAGTVRAQRWDLAATKLTASFTRDGTLYQVSLAAW